MRRLSTLLLSGLVWASLATTAQSQEGSALYEPFPGPGSVLPAELFVEQLPAPGSRSTLEVSLAELERGVVVDSQTGALEPARVPAGGAADRAAGGEGLAPSFGWLLGLVLIAIVCASATSLSRIASRVA